MRTLDTYTYEKAAKEYDIPEATIRNAVNDGVLPAIVIGPNTVRLLGESIEKWLRGINKTR